MIRFSQPAYYGDETSGGIHVTLLLEGGSSTDDITVTVMPSDQSPVSAQGKGSCVLQVDWLVSVG